MRILVLGHSGTSGYAIGGPGKAWPALLNERLTAAGRDLDMVVAPLFAVGSRAVDYALGRVEKEQPDVLVLSLNAYPCTIPVVSARIRRLFGERVHRWYSRVERRANKRSGNRPGIEGRLNRLARAVGRRVIGAEPLASVEEVAGVYEAILNGVVRCREGTGVVVLAEARFSPDVQSREKRLVADVDHLQARVRGVVESHRIRWIDMEEAFTDQGDRATFWMPDGVHLSAQGNERYAGRLARELLATEV